MIPGRRLRSDDGPIFTREKSGGERERNRYANLEELRPALTRCGFSGRAAAVARGLLRRVDAGELPPSLLVLDRWLNSSITWKALCPRAARPPRLQKKSKRPMMMWMISSRPCRRRSCAAMQSSEVPGFRATPSDSTVDLAGTSPAWSQRRWNLRGEATEKTRTRCGSPYGAFTGVSHDTPASGFRGRRRSDSGPTR